MQIRPASPHDAAAWCRMREALWPSATDQHEREINEFFAGARTEPQAVLIALDDAGDAVGFAELSIRPFAEECYSGRVAYLDGLYVVPDARRQGIARALVGASEGWGRSAGCVELASDTELTNDVSAAAHLALGFVEVGRSICFRKDL